MPEWQVAGSTRGGAPHTCIVRQYFAGEGTGNDVMATVRLSVHDLELEIADGEFLTLVGPPGCGKSTTLRMLAGLEEVDAGRILIDGQDVTDLSPRDRDVAMVFQNYALYPHMTVADNMGFALRIAGVDAAEIRRRVEDAAQILDLTDHLDQVPKALSGGQRQRVAMGRAIVREPTVFLMDEPLNNLDAQLREQTRAQIADLQRRLGITTVYVTHDPVEAMTMGDRVAVMAEGELQQVDTPHVVHHRPANLFVATFIGVPTMNVFEADACGGVVPFGTAHLSTPDGVTSDGLFTLGVRPQELMLAGEGLPATVHGVEQQGDASYLRCAPLEAGPDDRPILALCDAADAPAQGSTVHLLPRTGATHYFDAVSGRRLAG